jgi:diguanylate cyclase (GGDEF)-like protein
LAQSKFSFNRVEVLDMEATEDLAAQLQQAQSRAREAEHKLELAKAELLKLSTGSEHEELARAKATIKLLQKDKESLAEQARAAREKVASLASEVQKFRASYLSDELDNSILREKLNAAEERLASVVKSMPASDQVMVREQSLSWLALQDSLTRLANGNKLDMELEQVVRLAQDSDHLVVLLLLDLDHFHTVNDMGGWKAGNALLLEVAQRLQKLVQGSATFLARRGEDEFAALFSVPRPEGNSSAVFETPLIRVRQLADLVLQVFSAPFELAGQRVPVSASMGLSVYPNDADSGQELLENAHSALRAAKVGKRGSYLFFNDRLYLEREDRVGLGAELAKVIEQEKLLFLYRPLASVARGSLAAAQVEAFWEHPTHGRVAQAYFLPLAESLGLAHRVADQSLQAALALSRKVKGSIPVQVTFPPSVLGRAELVKQILEQVSKSRTRPESLHINLPAEGFTRWPREAASCLEELARWRIGRGIVEVGSGAIPLNEICSCRPDLIGLAESLTGQTPHIESQTLLVKSLLTLFKSLGLATRADGVTDRTQAHFLALHQCDYLSGDFVSPGTNLDDFLARKRMTWTFK